jgi:nitrile hydratase
VNGIHDMGGMDGFGPVVREENEPPFHFDWERQIFAITLASGWTRNADELRHAIERIPPPRYLNSSYYEKWLDAIEILLVDKGVLSRDELEKRGADPPTPSRPLTPWTGKPRPSASRQRARFREGDLVIARNLNPPGHTRLPRYVRGKRGVIKRNRGVYVFADSNALGGGQCAQPVYSVEFKARELWGPEAPARDCVRIDLWEDYLEAAKPAGNSGASRQRSATGRKKR